MAVISNGTNRCTAAAVGPRLLVTSARCAVTVVGNGHVFVGSALGLQGTNISIGRVIKEFVYDETDRGTHGLAITELASSVPNGTQFMTVSVSRHLPGVGTYVRVAGYGRFSTASDDSKTDPRLHQVDLPVYDGASCDITLPGIDRVDQFCVGYQRSGACDACIGHEGAPQFRYDRECTPVIFGVTVGSRCGDEVVRGYPFTRTWPFRVELDVSGLQDERGVVYEVHEQSGSGMSTAVIAGAAVAIVGGTVWWRMK